MKFPSSSPVRWAARVALGLSMFLSVPAHAQDAPKSPPTDADANAPKDNDKGKDAQPAPPEAETDDPAAAPAPPGGLERMPAAAFWPPPYLRGLYGSSVWLSTGFHGLQWPYYRKTGVGFSGDVWVDNSYETVNRQTNLMSKDKTEPDDKKWIQQARLVLRVVRPGADRAGRFQGAGYEREHSECRRHR